MTNDHEDDDLCALIDHEADGVCEAVAAASNLPACVDHVDLSLDLISDSLASGAGYDDGGDVDFTMFYYLCL